MKILSLLLISLSFSLPSFAGKVIVNHDEWTLSNTGFSQSADATVFTQNIANYFTGGSSGSFFAYSTNFGLTGTSLNTAFTSAGHSYTTGTGISFDVATLLTYDGIFVAGNTPGLNNNVLIDYVNAGGNVYLAGGTAQGLNGFTEASYWNPFLNAFDLSFASPYNGIFGNLALPSQPHSIFNNVNSLYYNNGNTVVSTGANATSYFSGLFGIYEQDIVSVPEAQPLAFLVIAIGLFFMRRKTV